MRLGGDIVSLRVEESPEGPRIVFYDGIGASWHVLSRATVDRVRGFAEGLLELCDDIEKHYDAKLDVCPFCGGKASPEWDYPRVRCRVCGAYRSGKTLDEAIMNWNRRVRQ